MARRGFGGTALRAALGAVSGITEGLQQREILAAQRKQQEEINAINALNMFRAAGGGITLAGGRPVSAAMQESFALPEAKLPAPTMDPSTFRQGFTQATKADLGVAPRPTGLLDTPIRLALETAPRQVTQAQPPVTPRRTMKAGGMEFELIPSEEFAQQEQDREIAKLTAQQKLIADRTTAERDRANRGYFSVLKRAGALGAESKNLSYEDVKDIDLEPFFKEYTQGRTIEAAANRTAQMVGAQAGMGTFVQGVQSGDAAPQLFFGTRGGTLTPTGVQAPTKAESAKSEMQTGLQGMGVARANSALNLLETNAKAMDKFEKDLLENKASINFVQLELARKALKGDAGSAAAEAALAKTGESGRAILRYVRGGKAIAGAVREITPRGGSNLMMQMETALSGIGPAGADPESVDQVQIFRNDLLSGVREGVKAMSGKQSQPTTPGGRPPLSSFERK